MSRNHEILSMILSLVSPGQSQWSDVSCYRYICTIAATAVTSQLSLSLLSIAPNLTQNCVM